MARFLAGLVVALTAAWPAVASAAPVFWTDWTSAGTGTVSGTLTVGSDSVGVTHTGGYAFAQTAGGTNYWSPPAPYLSTAVDNAPPASDIIGLGAGGTVTVTFSAPVTDPLIALVSWNGNTVDFGEPIEFLSYGLGYWGSGTPILNGEGDGFFGSGEVHGVIRLAGPHTSFSFTHTSEVWHGYTVGVAGLYEGLGTACPLPPGHSPGAGRPGPDAAPPPQNGLRRIRPPRRRDRRAGGHGLPGRPDAERAVPGLPPASAIRLPVA
jgi:hypothetical protein